MALIPKISFSISSNCDKLDIYDETSPYVLATNAGGWVNSGTVAANIDTSEITASDVKFYDYTGVTLLDTIVMYDGVTDVYTGVTGAPAPGAFLAVKNHTWEQLDGVYKVLYTVVGNATTFTNAAQHELFTCNLDNCIDSLAADIITECNNNILAKKKETLDQLELFLYGIKSAFSCKDFVTATSLIADAKLICDNLCDCGCGDC